jgi:sugar phosphate isomerase/epimerase
MIVLSTGSLHNYSINRIFALAAETGFDGIEVIVGRKWDTRDPTYLRHLSSECGLPIVALHTPFVLRLKNWPTNELKRLERTVALAQELEVQLVVAHLPLRFKRVVVKLNLLGARRFVLALPRLRKGSYFHFVGDGRLHEMESSSGVIVALENMPAHRLLGLQINAYWFNSPARMSRFSHLTLDTTHLGTWGLNPVEIYEQLRERVVHVHLSNFDGRDHRSPVDGHLPLATLLRRLAQDSYPGAISVECSPDALQAEDEGKCRLELAAALTFCREHFSVGENRFE